MPSAPPVIYTPPTPGGTPAAPAAPFEPAPAGKNLLLISGVSTAGVNGYLRYAGRFNNYPAWSTDGTQVSGPANAILNYNGTTTWWLVMGSTYSVSKVSAAATPDGLTSWTIGLGTGSPVITATTTPPAPAVITV